MPPTIDATPGGASANSYLTQAEADAYFDSRMPLTPAWADSDSKAVNLVNATRMMDAMMRGTARLVDSPGRRIDPYYIIDRMWTGVASTTTQKLAWPRTGMLDAKGYALATDVIPQELKDATAELAGQLNKTDFALNNDVITQGITSIRAGSVGMTFKESFTPQVLPDAVVNLLVPSWYTPQDYQNANAAEFDVVSPSSEEMT